MTKEFIEDVALQDNTEERVPLVLVLDCSGSMEGGPIEALNEGLRALKSELAGDPIAAKRVRVMIVGIGVHDVSVVSDWQDLMDFEPPVLQASGATPTGKAMRIALRALEEEKARLRANGISYKRPWLFLMSDGEPPDHWEPAAAEARAAEAANKVAIFPIGVGEADLECLGQFSGRAAVRLRGLKFRELFLWLSASVKTASVSVKGEEVALPSPAGWATAGV